MKWFSSSVEGFPRDAEHLLALLPSLCGPSHPKPSRLGLGQVTVEARSSGAALHHSPSWSALYTAWYVWGHFLVGKMVHLNANRMGWHVAVG